MSLATLETALESLDSLIAELLANPKPSYSHEGKSVSWESYYNTLLTSREKLKQAIQVEAGPVELRTQAIT